MASAGTSGDHPADWSSDDSDSESDCSDCSEQSTYDDEQVVSVQAAELALACLQSTVDRGHRGAARVAHRPLRQSDTVEQANVQMAALHPLNTTGPGDLQSLDVVEAPEIQSDQSVAWAVGAASMPTSHAPPTPVQPLPQPPSVASIVANDADARRRGPATPLRREDARRIVGELDSTSPLSTMQSVARAAELAEVRLSCVALRPRAPPSTAPRLMSSPTCA